MPERPATENGQAPLAGLRVIEIAHVAAAPFAGLVLSDLGADVVKVEPPAGDTFRRWPPVVADGDEDYSLNFAVVNRGKRSLVADLHVEEDADLVRRLVGAADVLIENFRPGTLAKYGLDAPTLRGQYPRLVYASLSGYGQGGPAASLGAYDVVIQGAAGVLAVTGEESGPPAKCGVPFVDFTAGLFSVVGILAALRRRDSTGKGSYVDCSMLGSVLAISSLQFSEYWGTGRTPTRRGSAHPRNAPYQAFRTRDGYITVAAGNDRLWKAFCTVVELPQLLQDARFRTQASRAEHQAELVAATSGVLRERDSSAWLVAFERAGVPAGPVLTHEEVADAAQVRHLGLIDEMVLPNGSRSLATRLPVLIDDWHHPMGAPPALGEHGMAVVDEWLSQPSRPERSGHA